MYKRAIVLIVMMLTGISTCVFAQKGNLDFSRLESGLLTVENPFKSKLPKIEKPKIPEPIINPDDMDASANPLGIPGLPKPVMEKPKVVERPVPNVVINGIIWNSDRPQAIINGQIVDIGDTISEIQITNIQKLSIDGIFDGRNVTLKP